MTTNLEQIAKQVSLLNRLIELLRYGNTGLGWLELVEEDEDGIRQLKSTIEKKAWSDELVKIAKEFE